LFISIHILYSCYKRCNDRYKEGPSRKWDINPELPIVEENTLRLEDMRWRDLDDSAQQSSTISKSKHKDAQPRAPLPPIIIRTNEVEEDTNQSNRASRTADIQERPSVPQGRIDRFFSRRPRQGMLILCFLYFKLWFLNILIF
jgi:hypothetical protein